MGTGRLYEYLEKVLEASFKREYEQDENVVRSLPFFATALGVLVAIFTQVVTRVPGQGFTRLAVILLLGLSAFAFIRILWCLFQTVRVRQYLMPPNEVALIKWCNDLRDYHIATGRTGQEAEAQVVTELRLEMIETYAASASHNRSENNHKTRHRTAGLTWLVILMMLATNCIAVIFLESQLSPVSNLESKSNGEISKQVRQDRPDNGQVRQQWKVPVTSVEAHASQGHDR